MRYVLKLANLNTILRWRQAFLSNEFVSMPSMPHKCDNSAERLLCDSGHPGAVIEGGITFYPGSCLQDSGRSHLCGPTVPQRHPKRSKHHWKSGKQPEKVPNMQKCMKIKDFMKSDVDFRYSEFILSKALTQRARVPNGMPQLQIL